MSCVNYISMKLGGKKGKDFVIPTHKIIYYKGKNGKFMVENPGRHHPNEVKVKAPTGKWIDPISSKVDALKRARLRFHGIPPKNA